MTETGFGNFEGYLVQLCEPKNGQIDMKNQWTFLKSLTISKCTISYLFLSVNFDAVKVKSLYLADIFGFDYSN